MEYEPEQEADERTRERRTYQAGTDTGPDLVREYLDSIEEDDGLFEVPDVEQRYETAHELVTGRDVAPADIADSAVVYDDDPQIDQVGYLFTAAYHCMEEDAIVFDHPGLADLDIEGLGYGLEDETTLVIETPVAEAGRQAEGTIVNAVDPVTDDDPRRTAVEERGYRDASDIDGAMVGTLGQHAEGTVINQGMARQVGPLHGATVQNEGIVKDVTMTDGRLRNKGAVQKLAQKEGATISGGWIHTAVIHDGQFINDGEVETLDAPEEISVVSTADRDELIEEIEVEYDGV